MLETDWPAWSEDNDLSWDITANPWRDVSLVWHSKDWQQVGLTQEDPTPTYMTFFLDEVIDLLLVLVPVVVRW